MILYRADGRTMAEIRERDGFQAWCPLDLQQARKFACLFTGSTDDAGLPAHLQEQFGDGKKKLNDLSAYIKWTKDKSSTVWISTAINDDCGGQGSGGSIFRIEADLKEYDISGSNLVLLQEGRRSNLKPSLVLDGDTIMTSTIIALNHGPKDDAEVSFLTAIPNNLIKDTL